MFILASPSNPAHLSLCLTGWPECERDHVRLRAGPHHPIGRRSDRLHRDLLGLKVPTDPIHLNITAQSGSGELLCAVAGLLDGGNLGTQPATLLNQILAILNGL